MLSVMLASRLVDTYGNDNTFLLVNRERERPAAQKAELLRKITKELYMRI